MSTPLLQRTPFSPDIRIMQSPFDIHDGAVDPIQAMGKLLLPHGRVILPEHPDAEHFSITLDPQNLPPQIPSRHGVYFGNLQVDDLPVQPVAIKTYLGSNGSENWRKEFAAHEKARRAGLNTLNPVMLLKTRSGATLMATKFLPDLFDLERRHLGEVPANYDVDELKLMIQAASALASQHLAGLVNGDAAPRNFAYRGNSSSMTPYITDPESYVFPGEKSVEEVKRGQTADVISLVNETASVVLKKQFADEGTTGKKPKIREADTLKAQEHTEEVIAPVYKNITGHYLD